MDISMVLNELDELFMEQDLEKIDTFLRESREQAEAEQDLGALLILYNETIGFYRETGNYKPAALCAFAAFSKVVAYDTFPSSFNVFASSNAL